MDYRVRANDAAGCRAYWRTANNMNDLTGDYNSPNADWWVYKWYADMVGQELSVTSTDNNVLRAVASRNTDTKTVEVLYAGAQMTATARRSPCKTFPPCSATSKPST